MLDDRSDSGARDDGATFAPAMVRGARRPRLLAGVVLVAVGAIIAVGALDRQPDAGAVSVAPSAPAAVAAVRTQVPIASTRPRRTSDPSASVGVPEDAVFDLDVRPAGSHLFVHGDVFRLAVSRVRVRIEDAAGHVAATRAVDLPGGSTAFLIGAVPRFDVHFFLPDEIQSDGFIVLATALDAKGHRMATIEQRIPRASASM